MQVNRIQGVYYNPGFKAKLDISGEMFYGEVFDKMFEKASKIGTEKDVIDIKYVGYFASKPKKAGNPEKHSGVFDARFIIKGGNKKGDDRVKQNIADTSRYGYREKAKKAAIEYIDNLYAKYVR